MFRGHLRRSVEFFFTMEQFCLSNARGCTCMQVRQYTVLPMFTRYSTDLQVVATHQEMAAMCQQRPGRSYKLLVYKDVNNAGFKKYWKKSALQMFYMEGNTLNTKNTQCVLVRNIHCKQLFVPFTRKLHSAPF